MKETPVAALSLVIWTTYNQTGHTENLQKHFANIYIVLIN